VYRHYPNKSPPLHVANPAAAALLLLASDGLDLTLASARVGLRALAADRQVANVHLTPVALDLFQTLNVHRDGASEFTLNLVLLHLLTKLREFLLGKLAQTLVLQPGRRHDGLGASRANTVHVGQRSLASLVVRDFDARNTRRADTKVATALHGRL
jgi:hypothetical protein